MCNTEVTVNVAGNNDFWPFLLDLSLATGNTQLKVRPQNRSHPDLTAYTTEISAVILWPCDFVVRVLQGSKPPSLVLDMWRPRA